MNARSLAAPAACLLVAVLSLSLPGPLAAADAATAATPAARPAVEFLNAGPVLPDSPPFSEAVRVGNLLFLSGKLGTRPGTRELAPGGMAGEAKQVMENIKATLERYGHSMSDLVKCTVMLTDMSEWAAFNEIYRRYFSGRYPARSAFGASGLALGAKVEVECIAAVGE